MAPKISIITINFNDKIGLQRTFDSVFQQEFEDFEYIVIDGGSNDGSKELIEENADKISFWISESDKGIYNAMNKGIKAAKGEYLLFLNSGDHFYTEKSLSIASQYLGVEEIIYSDLNVINNNEKKILKYPKSLSLLHFIQSSLPHPSTFIKKTAFDQYGFYDENLKFVSDWKWFLLAICSQKATYKHIEEIISTFYMDGISSNIENLTKLEQESESVFDEYYAVISRDIKEIIKLQKSNHDLRNFEAKYNHLKKYRLVKLLHQIGLIKIPK